MQRLFVLDIAGETTAMHIRLLRGRKTDSLSREWASLRVLPSQG